jgi:hypothetical protein
MSSIVRAGRAHGHLLPKCMKRKRLDALPTSMGIDYANRLTS